MDIILLVHACSIQKGGLDWNRFSGDMNVFVYQIAFSENVLVTKEKNFMGLKE